MTWNPKVSGGVSERILGVLLVECYPCILNCEMCQLRTRNKPRTNASKLTINTATGITIIEITLSTIVIILVINVQP
jgi:hypothetical protein